jgi:hypothetical protein
MMNLWGQSRAGGRERLSTPVGTAGSCLQMLDGLAEAEIGYPRAL